MFCHSPPLTALLRYSTHILVLVFMFMAFEGPRVLCACSHTDCGGAMVRDRSDK